MGNVGDEGGDIRSEGGGTDVAEGGRSIGGGEGGDIGSEGGGTGVVEGGGSIGAGEGGASCASTLSRSAFSASFRRCHCSSDGASASLGAVVSCLGWGLDLAFALSRCLRLRDDLGFALPLRFALRLRESWLWDMHIACVG